MKVKVSMSLLFVIYGATAFAQTAKPADAASQPLDIKIVNAQQKWRNAMEFNCRGNQENYQSFQARINARLNLVGESGWELVSISNAPLQKSDCLAFAFRQPSGK